MRRLAVMILAGVVLLSSSPALADDTHDFSGSVTTFFNGTPGPGADCLDDPYNVAAGDRVLVRNQHGTTVAITKLKAGVLVERADSWLCRYPFKIRDLKSAKFYRFTIGNVKPYEVSRRELAHDHWKLKLSIT